MSILTLCLLSMVAPQQKSKVVLPPPPPIEAPVVDQTQLPERERFLRDANKLRRSVVLGSDAEDVLLNRLRLDYQDPAALALRCVASADTDMVYGLVKVVGRFSTDRAKAADELLFLLQNKPFGAATHDTVATMADLEPEKAKTRLLACLTTRYAGLRKAATDQLLARIDQSDVERLVTLASDQDEDIRRKALFLLGALPYPPARRSLVEAIGSPRPTIAATASQSLVAHGADVAADLQPMLTRPAFDRTFGYAAFALTVLEDQTGRALLTPEMLPFLLREVRGTDTFLRVASALALANLAFRSDDARGEAFADRDIVDGLLLVVAPRDYVPNISMLQKPAARKLVQFTGQDFRGRSVAWRGWWDKARPGFVGMRLRVAVTADNGGDAVLTWTSEDHTLRFVGERAVAPPAPGLRADAAARLFEFRLTGPEMAALVQRLESLGFMGKGLIASAGASDMLPVARTLELQLGTFQSRVAGPSEPVRWIDVLEEEVRAVADRERWQLYLPGATEAERLAQWHAEREWLAGDVEPAARDARLKDHIIAGLPQFPSARRELALGHLLALPNVAGLLTEADGGALIDLAARTEFIDDDAFRLLEVALLVPGERIWRRVLDIVDDHREKGGREAMPRIFSLLGAERVLEAVRSARPSVRVAAMHEAANMRDVRAVPALLAALDDGDRTVRETAVYALGVLQVAAAYDKLTALQAQPDLQPAMRRVVWVALGRIGGEGVLPILKAATGFPDVADQLAALQAMGEMQDPEAASFLALVFASRGYGPLGTQAVASLQKMGGLLARPALRAHLRGREPTRERDIVLLLAEFQDPTIVELLMPMLDDPDSGMRAAMLLATITGVDLTEVNNRVAVMRDWWRGHKDLPQAMWYLESLQRERVSSTLTADDLRPKSGVDAVPELTRLLLAVDKPYLRVMTAALLRETTDREFGRVSVQTTAAQLQAIADRYRYFADAEKGGKR